MLSYIPETKNLRLWFRKPFWSHCFYNFIKNYEEVWRTKWNECTIADKDIIEVSSNEVPSFDRSFGDEVTNQQIPEWNVGYSQSFLKWVVALKTIWKFLNIIMLRLISLSGLFYFQIFCGYFEKLWNNSAAFCIHLNTNRENVF